MHGWRSYRDADCLIAAIRANNPMRLQYLLDQGANVNSVAKHSYRPVQLAVQSNLPSIVKLLISYGADLTVRRPNSATLLHLAVETGDASLMRLLLEQGCDPDVQDDRGFTPLMVAVATSDMKLCRALLDHGASVSLKDHEGGTVFHNTALGATEELTRLLIERCEDDSWSQPDLQGRTPLYYSVSTSHLPSLLPLLEVERRSENCFLTQRNEQVKYSFVGEGDIYNCTEFTVSETLLLLASFSRDPSICYFLVQAGYPYRQEPWAKAFCFLVKELNNRDLSSQNSSVGAGTSSAITNKAEHFPSISVRQVSSTRPPYTIPTPTVAYLYRLFTNPADLLHLAKLAVWRHWGKFGDSHKYCVLNIPASLATKLCYLSSS